MATPEWPREKEGKELTRVEVAPLAGGEPVAGHPVHQARALVARHPARRHHVVARRVLRAPAAAAAGGVRARPVEPPAQLRHGELQRRQSLPRLLVPEHRRRERVLAPGFMHGRPVQELALPPRRLVADRRRPRRGHARPGGVVGGAGDAPRRVLRRGEARGQGHGAVGGRGVAAAAPEEERGAGRDVVAGAAERRRRLADGAVAREREGDEEGGAGGVERDDRVRRRRGAAREVGRGSGGVAAQEDGAVAGEAERVRRDEAAAAPAVAPAAAGAGGRAEGSMGEEEEEEEEEELLAHVGSQFRLLVSALACKLNLIFDGLLRSS